VAATSAVAREEQPSLASSHATSRQTAYRLFCFPYAGGGASSFRSWQPLLPEQIELCAMRLPGRDGRVAVPAFQRMAPLVAHLVNALRSRLDLPFALFGHSMGALVAFEVARQLRRERLPAPCHLFVSGFRAPQLPDDGQSIHELPDGPFRDELRRLGGTPPAILDDAELMELVLPNLRADFAVCETYAYTPEAPLDCPVTAFGGRDDVEVSRADLAAWRAQTRGAFKIRQFAGDHFFLNTLTNRVVQAMLRAMGL
jgi:medium-chain acyl-[acyl-carrier-protein] hydrolase